MNKTNDTIKMLMHQKIAMNPSLSDHEKKKLLRK